jgi:hypothetical protein
MPDSDKPLKHDWYSRISQSDRRPVDAVATWLAPVQWQLFATFTFERQVTAATADSYFRKLINHLEKNLRGSVCFVAARERKTSTGGVEGAWHFHALLTSHSPIPTAMVENSWRNLVGKGHRTQAHPLGDSVDVRPFDQGKRGVEYCLKLVNDCDGDWFVKRLEEFHPDIPFTSASNHHAQRRRRKLRLARQKG